MAKESTKIKSTEKKNVSSSSITLLQSAVAETSKKVSSSLLPSIENHVQNNKFDKSDGLDFLDAKNSIMLSYMIDLTQLLRLKSKKDASNKHEQKHEDAEDGDDNDVKIQECLGRLREMKIVLEKIRPLEKKMRYQLDKLLALSASSSAFSAAATITKLHDVSTIENSTEDDMDARGIASVAGAAGENTDPLAFRPNPESLLGKDDDASDNEIVSNDGDEESLKSVESSDDNEEDEDDELAAARAALNAGRSKKQKTSQIDDGEDADNDNNKQKTGVYKAPRLASVPFIEKEKQTDKEERILKRQRDRMRKSEVLSTLRASFGDAPEEDDVSGGAALGKQRETSRRFNEKMQQREEFEEDNMIRITMSRKEKKMRKKIMREEHSNLNTIADIGNITAGVTAAFGIEKKGGDQKGDLSFEAESSRHSNGKRRRDTIGFDDKNRRKEERNANPKNSFQKALYGMEGASGKKRKKSGRKK